MQQAKPLPWLRPLSKIADITTLHKIAIYPLNREVVKLKGLQYNSLAPLSYD